MKKLFVILLISINLFAWEVNTHRAIDQKALSASNLNTFVDASGIGDTVFKDSEMNFERYGRTYVDYILNGEKDGITQWGQTFPTTGIKYTHLLEAGTILEDAQWPHAISAGYGRFLNHFYDYQGIFCKSLHCIATDAIEWAYDSGNQYDYTDAMKYFAQGFSEPNKNNKMKEA